MGKKRARASKLIVICAFQPDTETMLLLLFEFHKFAWICLRAENTGQEYIFLHLMMVVLKSMGFALQCIETAIQRIETPLSRSICLFVHFTRPTHWCCYWCWLVQCDSICVGVSFKHGRVFFSLFVFICFTFKFSTQQQNIHLLHLWPLCGTTQSELNSSIRSIWQTTLLIWALFTIHKVQINYTIQCCCFRM